MIYNLSASYPVPSLIVYSLSTIALAIGSITDLKTREVPDYVNYGLIISGIALNLLFSIVYSSFSFIINSIVGLLVFFGIAYIMFYAGQWGGGDSKMLMGLGSMIGIDVGLKLNQFLASFLINALLIGAIYGLIWSFFLVVKNKKKFWKEFRRKLLEKKIVQTKRIILVLLIVFVVSFLFARMFYLKLLFLSAAFLILMTFYLWIFVRAVEKACMHKMVEPSKLTEGDWIAEEVVLKKKIFLKKTSKELGKSNLIKIQNRKNNLLDVEVSRKFLFFRFKAKISPESLRSTDILDENLFYGDYICGPKDLGIDKKQIKSLIELYRKKEVGKILIKEGVPFVPSFFIAFTITLFAGNPLKWIL